MKKMELGRLPIYSWASEIEDGALAQAVNLSNLSFAVSHIAIMPDVHEGYGMPIGGVLATDGMIIPNAVGVDIGCGIVAVQTDQRRLSTKQIQEILAIAKRKIPVGFRHHRKAQPWKGFEQAPDLYIIKQELNSARRQLGTLGGGNHFASIEQGSDGFIWLMVHTGSRNIGLKVATHYNKIAKRMNDKHQFVPGKFDLAPLPLDTQEGQEYLSAMNFCLEFARANRQLILHRLFEAFQEITNAGEYKRMVDIHHNYAAIENHFNQKVVLHRKGATKAAKGQYGIIPGSMGTSSFIVLGLGNPMSFNSSSHGAGRVMSRTQAKKQISLEEANRSMKGIVHDDWRGDVSEAPMAYKDIEEVMELQKDLVKPEVRLNPLGVMKG